MNGSHELLDALELGAVLEFPILRDAVDVSTGQMGLNLFGLSIGSMAGVLASGHLTTRVGTRPVIASGCVSVVAGAAPIGVSSFLGLGAGVFAGLVLFGLGMGRSEIAINIEGAEVERVTGMTFLPLLHGFFSLGTAFGALTGIGLTAMDFPVIWHPVIISAALVAIALWAIPKLAEGRRTAAESVSTDDPPARSSNIWRSSGLILIAVIVLAMAFAKAPPTIRSPSSSSTSTMLTRFTVRSSTRASPR